MSRLTSRRFVAVAQSNDAIEYEPEVATRCHEQSNPAVRTEIAVCRCSATAGSTKPSNSLSESVFRVAAISSLSGSWHIEEVVVFTNHCGHRFLGRHPVHNSFGLQPARIATTL